MKENFDDPFKEDSTEFNPNTEGKLLYQGMSSITSYLKTGSSDSYHFLIGPKGMGKSMLIRQKAHNYLNQSGVINISGSQLTENISISERISVRNTEGFQNVDDWDNIWTFCINTTILRHLDVELPAGLQELIQNSKRISDILTRVIKYRSDLQDYLQFSGVLSELVEEHVQSGILLCLDSIDAAFKNLVSGTSFDKKRTFDKAGELPPSVKVWVNCQNGAVRAAHAINDKNAHITVLVTLRTEAFNALRDQFKANYRAKAVVLTFDKTDMGKMFEQKLSLLRNKDLIRPDAESLFARLVGFNTMEHPYAGTGYEGGKRKKENVYDFFFRHTFGRPRELTTIGKKVLEKVRTQEYQEASKKDRKTAIRYHVNCCATEILLDNYLNEVIPTFDHAALATFLRSIRKNVFKLDEVLDPYIVDVTYYYNLGLIGCTREKHGTTNQELIQHFLPVAQHGFVTSVNIPETDYLLLHPCLDHLMYELLGTEDYYNRFNIIGNGEAFDPPARVDFDAGLWLPKKVCGTRFFELHDKLNDRPLQEYYLAMGKSSFMLERGLLKNFGQEFFATLQPVFRQIALCGVPANQYWPELNKLKKIYRDKLENSRLACLHTKKLKDPTDPQTISAFYDKLIARLVFLACLYHTRLPFFHVKSLITRGYFDVNDELPKGKSLYNYLSNAFFVPQIHSAEPGTPKSRSIRRAIWPSLSPLEQQLLREVRERTLDDFSQFAELPEEHRRKCLDTIASSLP